MKYVHWILVDDFMYFYYLKSLVNYILTQLSIVFFSCLFCPHESINLLIVKGIICSIIFAIVSVPTTNHISSLHSVISSGQNKSNEKKFKRWNYIR